MCEDTFLYIITSKTFPTSSYRANYKYYKSLAAPVWSLPLEMEAASTIDREPRLTTSEDRCRSLGAWNFAFAWTLAMNFHRRHWRSIVLSLSLSLSSLFARCFSMKFIETRDTRCRALRAARNFVSNFNCAVYCATLMPLSCRGAGANIADN